MTENKPWTYSHTQLSLWKQCRRRYYNAYILGRKEPTTDNMAAGTWLCQAPIEAEARIGAGLQDRHHPDMFNLIWANFLAEFGGDDSYDHPLFTLKLAKQILKAYQANPIPGNVVEIEKTFEKEFVGGFRYRSRPDLVVSKYLPGEMWPNGAGGQIQAQKFIKTTWDIKLKTFTQRFEGDTFYAQPTLSAFDDQCLGQAVLAGADSFGQIIFYLGKKDATLIGPVYVEHPVSPTLAAEWESETHATIMEIESWKATAFRKPWPKNDAACHSFGKDCAFLNGCNFGFESMRSQILNGSEK